nr:hypothetical protein [Saprospiraceae bacterium]
MKSIVSILLFIVVLITPISSQSTAKSKALDLLKEETANGIQAGYDSYKNIALAIWDYAEIGYKEYK